MPGDKYEMYGRPIAPADPAQEYMTVQETAHELKCSVSWLRRFLKSHENLHSRHGRRIVTDRADRAAIKAARRADRLKSQRPSRRTRPRLAKVA
ncbi:MULTISPECIES: DNA-binding protein [unclassified Streptomyces]|uniref:DNA-binding protein n=1 Tax=unclassified Streptomyces TaxID=2593676 RepID=UPI0037F8DBDD